MFGLKKTTTLKLGDKLALTALWFIFPLRFLAESFTSANEGGGNFLTGSAGTFFAGILPVHLLAYPAWWAYSISLGCFFAALPFSRYMHIPTEILLIFMRRFGVSEKEFYTTYTEIEVNSCSRCGICIDPCQLVSAADIRNVQSVYHIQSIRNKEICSEKSLNCLMCGRCDSICPVGIDISSIRIAGRINQADQKENCYSYVSNLTAPKTDIIFFGGCISKIQQGIRKSMVELLDASKISYWFMDEYESICCGRPLLLSGKKVQAMELMAKNKYLIEKSKAKTLVTSCPICYNMFKNEYNLSLRVMHHSEFLMEMAVEKKIEVKFQNISAVYHDPCELGRGAGIYESPRNLLSRMVNLKTTGHEKQNALCCGGSLANFKISSGERERITVSALKELTADEPDILVTGCPVCKKTFADKSSIQVLDIAEMVSKSLIRNDISMETKKNKKIVNADCQLIEN
jgi:Fe-S oxidoreductase